MEVGPTETLVVAILAFFLGRWLTRRVRWLDENSVPEAVTGGFLAAIVFSTAAYLGGPLEFATRGRDTLLLAFFATVGLEARWDRVLEGGRALLTMAGLALLMLPLQSLVGAGALTLTGARPGYGVLGGSVALSGGAGTVIALAPEFEAHGLGSAEQLGMAVAAVGMLLGAVLGGPLGRWLVRRHGLAPEEGRSPFLTPVDAEERTPTLSTADVLSVLLGIAVAMGLGIEAHRQLLRVGIDVPAFASTIIAGALVTNVVPLVVPGVRGPERARATALFSSVSLNIFVAMAVMAVPLGRVLGALGHMAVLLAFEVALMILYAVFVVFRAMGRDYDAAIMTSGYVGFGMGATPIAVANMSAITRALGPSPRAMLVIPLIGLLFFDVIHVFVVRLLLGWLA